VKFILAVISQELVVSNRKQKDVVADLERMGFDRMTKTEAAGRRGIAAAAEADDTGEEAAEDAAEGTSYLYLLSMAISSLTYEKVRTGWHWHGLYRRCVACLLSVDAVALTCDMCPQVQALEAEQQNKLAEVQRLENTRKEQLWSDDLDGFEAAYDDWLEEEERNERAADAQQLKAKAKNSGKSTVPLDGTLFVSIPHI
jgi:hypothetical protein